MDWEEIFKTIGAEKSNFKLYSSEIREIVDKLDDGNPITEEELLKVKETWLSDNPFLDANGNPFVLYIKDRNYRSWWGFTKYKYHFNWCSTLTSMNAMGRRARYVKKSDIDNNQFDSIGGRKEVLDVCQNCLNQFNFYDSAYKQTSVKDFSMNEFFAIYGKITNLKEPTHQGYEHQYPKDWHQKSRQYRESQYWTCEKCGKDMNNNKQDLHTHHINGVKDDTNPSNLVALCRDCHAEQPMHGHMKK